MPFINIKTNVSLSKEKEEVLKSEIGNAFSIIGKSENWVMMNFEDNNRMYFGGKNDSPMAFFDISVFGGASSSAYNKLTERLMEILNLELGINKDKIYIKYSETNNWGWNGSNF